MTPRRSQTEAQPTAPTTTDRLPAAARRHSIINAAWEILAEDGLNGLSIDAIVGRVGVSRPIFYRHFSDRTDLLTALYDDYAANMAERTEAVLRSATTLDDVLVGTVHAYLDCFEERGPAVRTLINHVTNAPTFDRARQRLRDGQMKMLVQSLVALGMKAPPSAIALHVRFIQAAVMEGATMLASGQGNRREIEDAILRIERATVAATLEELE